MSDWEGGENTTVAQNPAIIGGGGGGGGLFLSKVRVQGQSVCSVQTVQPAEAECD